jgi:EAL domain-containing protein (putative c-di-GMP-specific phosphodiesterase class I)
MRGSGSTHSLPDRESVTTRSTRRNARLAPTTDRTIELFEAVRGDAIGVHYQPIVDLRSTAIVGAEALLRWKHPTDGVLTAGLFASSAERCGVLALLGDRALKMACAALANWPANDTFTVRVNVNAQQLRTRGFVQTVESALANANLAPSRLVLEVTETMPMSTSHRVIENLTALRSLGIDIELDDFGTGYGSPLFLKSLPVTGIKLDRCFVSGLGRDQRDDAIVRNLTNLAFDLGLTVCAEGIEHEHQREHLLAIGVRQAQGYLFGAAVPDAELAAQLRRGRHNTAHPNFANSDVIKPAGLSAREDLYIDL